MNKEEIEELKDFTIDLTDIDELALGLEVCSKKSNMVIQEFANLIIELENQQKEFIEWLEAMNRMYQNEYKDIDTAEHYNCVLQKYKSIIGDDNQ